MHVWGCAWGITRLINTRNLVCAITFVIVGRVCAYAWPGDLILEGGFPCRKKPLRTEVVGSGFVLLVTSGHHRDHLAIKNKGECVPYRGHSLHFLIKKKHTTSNPVLQRFPPSRFRARTPSKTYNARQSRIQWPW